MRGRWLGTNPDLDTDLKGRVGLSYVETFFLEKGLILRRQPESDRGVDATVEIHEKGKIKLIALQIKTGKSYFEKHGHDYIYRGSHKHYSYWNNYPIPVFLVLVHPETKLMVFQHVEEHLCTLTQTGFTIKIPSANTLDDDGLRIFKDIRATDDESVLRAAFASDEGLMERVRDKTVFFRWEEWINKHVNFRTLKIYVDDYDTDPEEIHEYFYRAVDLQDAMRILFPWATYHYVSVQEYHSEVIEHLLQVTLRPAAEAYLEVQYFFRSGIGIEREIVPPEMEDDDDDYDDEAAGWERIVAGDD
ncbi:uncharacterized protein DUF4365 [Rhizobium sp. SJZ105]|nr:uncharacterized protein DUF4365 [Rhizobium sp. SJZ105]